MKYPRTETMIETSHDTVLIGWRKSDNKIVFLKSYEYLKEKEQAQADFQMIIDAGHTFKFGHIECLKFEKEEQPSNL